MLLLGEAPGEEEVRQGVPFVGASGDLLRRILAQAGLDYSGCYVTNVFSLRPPRNDIELWTWNKTEHKKAGITPRGGPIRRRYLRPDFWPMVEETRKFIAELKPDLIICLGAIAQWCLTEDARVGTFRGTFFKYEVAGYAGEAISTYHPAAVLRQWDFYPTVWADLSKARKALKGTIEVPLRRRIYYNPSWEEMRFVYTRFRCIPQAEIGVDVETAPAIDQITVIGFSTEKLGICIPFWDKGYGAEPGNVYANPADELLAWKWAAAFCQLPNPKVWQNGMYDSQYMLDAPVPLVLKGECRDTVLMHHSMQPELPKSLGHLASVYTNEPSWKQMRTSDKEAKAED